MPQIMVNGKMTEVDKWGNPVNLDKKGQPLSVSAKAAYDAAQAQNANPTGYGAGMVQVGGEKPTSPSVRNVWGQVVKSPLAAGGFKTYEDYNTDKTKDDLMYNPIQLRVNADGTKETQLRKEFQARGGSSDLAQMLSEAGQEEAFGRDSAVAKSQMAQDQARAMASMRGGRSMGNDALNQRSSMRDLLMAQQGVSGQAMQNRLGIQKDARAVDSQNAATMYGAVGDVNKFYLAKRAQDKQADAAQQNANAARYAAGSGSWVCTKVHEKNPLTKKDALALFKLRRFALKNKEEISRQYLYECKELVDKMVEAGEDFSNEENFVRQTINLVQEGKIEDAFNYYTKEILARIEKFWPECKLDAYILNKGAY